MKYLYLWIFFAIKSHEMCRLENNSHTLQLFLVTLDVSEHE